jgi:hypothetical protein
MVGSILCRDISVNAEDRIRDLCAQLLTTEGDDEIQQLVLQLKAAIHEHCENLKVLATVSYPRADRSF